MIADDLFAGAGGWDVAAQSMGIHARGIENMKEARATREAAGLTTIHDDVWTYQPDGAATGLIASPPCQTFSKAGKGNGAKALSDVLRGIRDGYCDDIEHLRFLGMEVGDERTALVLTPLHFALTGGYEWLAWEQVDTVLPVWEACADALRARGWNVWTGLLYSEQYGVPQTRKRAFLLASRRGVVTPPMPTHSRYHNRTPARLDEGVLPWVSMATALGWDWDFEVVSNYGTGGDPAATVTSKIDRNVVYTQQKQRAANDQGFIQQRRALASPAPTVTAQAPKFWRVGPEGDDPTVLPEWCHRRPSTTIVGSFKPEIVAAPGYRTTVSRQNAPGSVRVTVHEAGVLQSFRADHPWQGAKGKQFLQCGNAVPPLMAAAALSSVAQVESEAAA